MSEELRKEARASVALDGGTSVELSDEEVLKDTLLDHLVESERVLTGDEPPWFRKSVQRSKRVALALHNVLARHAEYERARQMRFSEMAANLEVHLGRDLTHDEIEMVWRSHEVMHEFVSTMARVAAIGDMEPEQISELAAEIRALLPEEPEGAE